MDPVRLSAGWAWTDYLACSQTCTLVEESPRNSECDCWLCTQMCRTRLELFSYTDYPNFNQTTPPPDQTQCMDLVNQQVGV